MQQTSNSCITQIEEHKDEVMSIFDNLGDELNELKDQISDLYNDKLYVEKPTNTIMEDTGLEEVQGKISQFKVLNLDIINETKIEENEDTYLVPSFSSQKDSRRR